MTGNVSFPIKAAIRKATRASSGATDLSYTASTRVLASSTGADATLPLFTSSEAGLAPSSGGGTTNFLRADGSWAAPGGGVSDGDKGDITVSGSGSTWTVDNGAITLSKMANLSTSTILGRATAGSGAPEALTATQVRTILNVADGATANSSDASLRDRATHTGTQAAGTITGLATVATSGSAADLGSGTLPAARMPALTGDVTTTVGTVSTTIANDAVTNAKLANVATATIKGRVTGGTGDPEDLTGTQATTLLDTFTTSLKGLAPASGGGTSNFLRADGTWAAPPAGGSLALTDLTDVTVSGATEGQVLVRGASEFQNLTSLTFTLGPFYINDMAATATTQATLGFFNTGTALSRNGVGIRMDLAGQIVGLVMVSDAARTAGTATGRVRVNGVGAAFNSGAVVLNVANTTSDSSFVAFGSGVAFAAGDTLGVEVTSSSWAPTTANFSLWLVVMLTPF